MKKTTVFKRLLSLALVLSVLLSWALPANALDNSISFHQVSNDSIYGDLFDREPLNIQEDVKRYADTDPVRVSIILNTPGTIEAGFDPDGIANNKDAMKYRANLKDEQVSVVDNIEDATNEELDIVWNMTLAANLISANITYGQVETIAKVSGVKAVVVEEAYNPAVVSSSVADPNMLTSGVQTGAPITHAAGYTGAGGRIAIIDTGLDIEHISVDAGAYYYSLGELASAKGMTPDDYIASLNLLDMAEIADVLDELNALDRAPAVDADGLYINAKVPFGFNYIDADLDIVHEMDNQGNHGSHVAGIAAANTYVPAGSGAYALSEDVGAAQGVAPDAQLIIMKVFGKGGGAFPSDYMVAIEDAIVLGADSINLSLGSQSSGMTYATETAFQLIMDNLVNSGTVVTMSAGNNGAWMDESQTGIPYLYMDDVNMHTGGSPGTYTNSLGVASMNNAGVLAAQFVVGGEKTPYFESANYGNAPIASIAGPVEYVFLNGIGTPEEFDALGANALDGKLVLCYRGTTSFFEKANAAVARGAKAVAIVNNTDGVIRLDLTGYNYGAPVVSMLMDGGEVFKTHGTPILGANNEILGWTGAAEISAEIEAAYYGNQYYTMSFFSSWGVPGDLSMKPEITAPGGDIHSISGAYSENGQLKSGDHASFEVMSGTSMAAPQVAGMAALVAQYIKENNLADKTGVNVRALAQSLLMSTAVPILDGNNNGYYYPVLQQGAGRADVGAAVSADSYLIMGADATDSYADGKIKVELGDDPQKKGEYTFSFTINNLTNEEKTYLLSADFFSQSAFSAYNLLFMDTMTEPLAPNVSWLVNGKAVDSGADLVGMDFNGDGYINSNDGQAILDYAVGASSALSNAALADIDMDNDVDSYDAYLFFRLLGNNGAVVPANGSAEIKVTVTLTDNDKAWLDLFENGTYLEGYVYAESLVSEEGVQGTSHSIPVLGFYGNWSDASMYDKGSYVEYAHGEESRPPYLMESNYAQGKMNGFKITYADDPGNEYWFGGNPYMPDDSYMPERNAIHPASTISSVGFTPIRNAAQMYLELWDPVTGGYYMSDLIPEYSPSYATYYSESAGTWKNTYATMNIGLTLNGLPDNLPLEIGLTSVLEYYVKDDGNVNWAGIGKGATMSIPMVVDSTAPVVSDIEIDGDIMKVTITDNQYIAAVALCDSLGQTELVEAGSDANQNAGETVVYNLDVSNVNGAGFLLFVGDYACNGVVYRINTQIGEVTDLITGVEISETSLTMFKGNTASLTAGAMPINAANRHVSWSSSNTDIVAVDADGNLLAKAVGTADIIATSVADPTKSAVCHVTVKEINTNLNAFVWDENGDVYYSSINTANLPNYTKLKAMSVDIATACVGPNGIIYGASFGGGLGGLYAIDPVTYEATEIGRAMVQGQNIMYTDLAYSPYAMGTGALFSAYQQFLIWVDPATGEGILIDEYPANIVGVVCLGDYMYPYQGTNYLLTDIMVILADGTIEYNAYASISAGPTLFGSYGAMSTGVSVGSAWYFNSAYFADNYLFWSAINPDSQDQATLYAIDVFDTGETYTLGKSPSDVWPIGGLHQNAAANAPISNNAISAFELNVTFGEEKAEFDLAACNKAKNGTANPLADAVVEEGADLITLKVTASDLATGLFTNGVTSVEYDAEALELKSILVNGDYVASAKEAGKVTFGYIDLDGVAADAVVATLVFEAKAPDAKPAKITYLEANNDKPATSEDVEVAYPHEHTKVINAKDPTCTEPGYTGDIFCEDCQEIIAKGREIEATGHQDTEIIGAKDATYTEPGYTGDTYCHDCDRVVAKGKEIPKKTPEGNGPPKTDDQSFFGLGLMLMLTSVSAIAVLTVSKKKYHN